ncbi:hypothetical protein P9112_005262 [Eukaryota sp. TZLM1-RC]
MYIADPTRTNGHTSSVKSIDFNAVNNDVIMTSSTDGTIRLWKTDEVEFGCFLTLSLRSAGWKGGVVEFQTSCFNNMGTAIASASNDSMIRFWDGAGKSNKPLESMNIGQFINGDSILKMGFTDGLESVNKSNLFIRTINSILLFDLRSLSKPVMTWHDVSSRGLFGDFCFNKDYTVFGASLATQGERLGSVAFGKVNKPEELSILEVAVGDVTTVDWISDLNQIIYGTSSGKIGFLYSPVESRHGILNCLKRKPRVEKDLQLEGPIVDPEELEGRKYVKRKQEKGPVLAPKSDGMDNSTGQIKINPTAALMEKALHLEESGPLGTIRDDDPREAILAKAEIAEKNPLFTGVYKKTQPKPVFDASLLEKEAVEYEQGKIAERMADATCSDVGFTKLLAEIRRMEEDEMMRQVKKKKK